MKRYLFFLTAVLFILIAASCDQGNSTGPAVSSGSRIQMLQGKWELISATITNPADPGRLVRLEAQEGDNFDFRNHNTLNTFIDGSVFQFQYKLLPDDSTLVTDEDTLVITSLTDELLVLRGKAFGGDIGVDSLRR